MSVVPAISPLYVVIHAYVTVTEAIAITIKKIVVSIGKILCRPLGIATSTVHFTNRKYNINNYLFCMNKKYEQKIRVKSDHEKLDFWL
ncbi:MAG: hypothetical protein GX638_08425 [Crenarchaeota archaeon]|nr:hypothetical protein [Thermoproteota archaeon]